MAESQSGSSSLSVHDVDRLVARLADDFACPRVHIRRAVEASLATFREARIREFVILFVERETRRRLAATVDSPRR